MKKSVFIIVLLSIIAFFTSSRMATRLNSEVLAVLGYTKTFADEQILYSVTSGFPAIIKPGNLGQIIAMSGPDKANLAKEFCQYIKSYCNSQEFKDKYETYRQSKKPQVPQMSEADKAYMREMIAEQEAMYTPEILEMLPPDARANTLAALDEMKASIEGELTADQKARWEAEVPSDPDVHIKTGLKKFLDESKDVDFNAETYMKDHRKVFTDPLYEAKPSLWKACYRAGSEVTQVGRDFAQAWLAELE